MGSCRMMVEAVLCIQLHGKVNYKCDYIDCIYKFSETIRLLQSFTNLTNQQINDSTFSTIHKK